MAYLKNVLFQQVDENFKWINEPLELQKDLT